MNSSSSPGFRSLPYLLNFKMAEFGFLKKKIGKWFRWDWINDNPYCLGAQILGEYSYFLFFYCLFFKESKRSVCQNRLPKLNKVHIFWEGHKILLNLHLTFDWHYIGQKLDGDFAKFCGLLRIYEPYNLRATLW